MCNVYTYIHYRPDRARGARTIITRCRCLAFDAVIVKKRRVLTKNLNGKSQINCTNNKNIHTYEFCVDPLKTVTAKRVSGRFYISRLLLLHQIYADLYDFI